MKITVNYIETNAYNAIVITDGLRWVCYTDIIDGIDITRENIATIVNNFTDSEYNDSDFNDNYNTAINNYAASLVVAGEGDADEFGTEYSETIYTYEA